VNPLAAYEGKLVGISARSMDPSGFHDATKHTPGSVRAARGLDWSNKPRPFKEYVDIDPLALPEPAPDTGVQALQAIAGDVPNRVRPLDAAELARLLVLGSGVLREIAYPDGEHLYFRTYASAGALYPIEVYAACASIDGVDPGTYHFHPLERSLRRIREGDPRPQLVRACGRSSAASSAPVTLILSGIPWRTTWKYDRRGYRHVFWDAGTMLANYLALTASAGHRSRVELGFVDAEIDALVGLDGQKEFTVALLCIGEGLERAEATRSEPEPMTHEIAPVSGRPRSYREISEVHAQARIGSAGEAERWASDRSTEPRVHTTPCARGIEQTIRARGSTRAFDGKGVPAGHLEAILRAATSPFASDWELRLRILGLIYSEDGPGSGAYSFEDDTLHKLADGNFRDEGTFLCLEQPLGGEGAATLFLLCDLEQVLASLGPRGYRACQLEAGIVAGRINLGTFACGFGSSPLTFYDDEIRRFFDTKDEPMLIVAVGRRSNRRLLPRARRDSNPRPSD